MDNAPVGSSQRTFIHLLQHDAQPSYYDYLDEGENIRKYGEKFPPLYPYWAINSTDIALFYLQRDWFNNIRDVHLLKQNLRGLCVSSLLIA